MRQPTHLRATSVRISPAATSRSVPPVGGIGKANVAAARRALEQARETRGMSGRFDADVRGDPSGDGERQASGMRALLTTATRDRDAKKVVAVGAAVSAGALAVKVAWDRLSDGQDPRRFRLRDGEPVPDGVVRVACGQLDLSIE